MLINMGNFKYVSHRTLKQAYEPVHVRFRGVEETNAKGCLFVRKTDVQAVRLGEKRVLAELYRIVREPNRYRITEKSGLLTVITNPQLRTRVSNYFNQGVNP